MGRTRLMSCLTSVHVLHVAESDRLLSSCFRVELHCNMLHTVVLQYGCSICLKYGKH
jgi:hypothetical protein